MNPAPRQARGGRTVELVLDAALELFGETGSVQAPIKELAARSGISIGSIYHHFAGLEGVSSALYSRCMAGLLERLLVSVRNSCDVSALIRSFVKAYLSWTVENTMQAGFIHASSFAPFIGNDRGEIESGKKAGLASLKNVLAPYVEDGTIRRLPDFLYEIIIVGPVAEVARRWLVSPEEIDISAAKRHLPKTILAALEARG